MIAELIAEVISAVGWVFLGVAVLGAFYALAAGLAVGWFFARSEPSPSDLPAVTVLKPLHGDETGLRDCLNGFCAQEYPGPVQIIFGVRESFDPAIQVVEQLVRDNPRLDIDLVIDDRLYGSNFKISNLINMERLIRHPVVVLADSDISVQPDYLGRVVGALSRTNVGFVTCVYVGKAIGNTWSRVSAMAINYHFLPSVALGMALRLAKPCFGPTIAFRKTTFDQIGGFARFANLLADDYEIGRAIRDLGYGFSIPPLLIAHACPERDVRTLLSHELRWARTIRMIDPLGYAGCGVSHALPSALIAAALLRASSPSLAVLGLVALSRMFVMYQVDRVAQERAGAWWLLLPRDLLSGVVFVGAFLVNSVSWKGRRFRVGEGGAILPHG